MKGLTLAWVYRLNTSRSGAIVGGEGPDTPPAGNPPAIKSTPLMINGVLYFSVPDHVWAVDARTGRELWHYAWRTRGGNHIGNRGVGILDKCFLLDRVTGEHLLTAKHIDSLNWTKGINAKGQPTHDPAKDPRVAGTLVSPDTSGATNWPPPSFNPDTGLLYFSTRQTYSVMYLTETDGRPQGWAAAERNVGSVGNALKAIDYRTGQVKWSPPFAMGPGGSTGGFVGLLSTAGGLPFGNDGGGNFVAYDAATGKPLWHAGLGTSAAPGAGSGGRRGRFQTPSSPSSPSILLEFLGVRGALGVSDRLCVLFSDPNTSN